MMSRWARRLGVGRTRRTARSLAVILVLGLAGVGVLAPSAQAAGSPFISFSPLLAGFGQTPAGATTSKTFTLKNSGKASTGALSIALTGTSAFSISADPCAGMSLAAGGSCTVTVAYSPLTSGRIDVAVLTAHNPNFSAVAAAGLGGTSVAAKADLSITNDDGTTTVSPGMPTTYAITVSNIGPSAVTGASITDMVPAALTSPTWTVSSTTGGATGSAPSTGNGTANLPVGSSITYLLTGTVSSTATSSLTLANTASVTAPAGVTDPISANNSATDTDTIGMSVTCMTGVNCAPLVTGNTSTGQLTVMLPSGTGTVQGAVFSGSLPCTIVAPDISLDPNTYEVITSAGSTLTKTVQLEFPATGSNVPVFEGSDDDEASGNDLDNDSDDVIWNEQVCFQAAPGVTFVDRDNASVNVGLLPDCPLETPGPCVDRSASSLTNGVDGTKSYDVVMTVDIPAGTSGDPQMH